MTQPERISDPTFEQEAVRIVDIVAEQARPGGGLYEVARVKTGMIDMSPSDVYDIVVPPSSAAHNPARWELVADASAKAKEAAAANKEQIFEAATATGMIRSTENEDYSLIQPEKAVVVVQDGANKTSIVRRAVAARGMRQADIQADAMYQLGSQQYIIKPTRSNGSANPEHALLRGLAGEYLPQGEFTAFDANLATALTQGYSINSIVNADPATTFTRALELTHEDSEQFPKVVLVEPTGKNLSAGLDAVRSLEEQQGRDLSGRQFVIGTNGQYRPITRFHVTEWSEQQGLDMLPAVALGDEPGDQIPYGETLFTTAERNATVYANELALLGRKATAYANSHGIDFHDEHDSVSGEWPQESSDGKTYTGPDDIQGVYTN